MKHGCIKFDRTNTSLLFIEAAIKRIEEGLYGICIGCEKEISVQRLKSVPGAIRCTFCQELDDLRGNNGNRRLFSLPNKETEMGIKILTNTSIVANKRKESILYALDFHEKLCKAFFKKRLANLPSTGCIK